MARTTCHVTAKKPLVKERESGDEHKELVTIPAHTSNHCQIIVKALSIWDIGTLQEQMATSM